MHLASVARFVLHLRQETPVMLCGTHASRRVHDLASTPTHSSYQIYM